MSLQVDIALTRGALALEVAFTCAGGETLALVGPNGAGKSTILSAVAGLVRAASGTISLEGEILDGGAGGPFVEPGARGVGFVFQDHRLFPGMSVLENVAFGPRARGISRRAAREEAMRWIERVGMETRARSRTTVLSGGEAQRVALARALAARPRVLLLDEPLAAVDASGRLAFRRLLREHLAAFAGPRLLVAHDVEDAVALADRIAVVEEEDHPDRTRRGRRRPSGLALRERSRRSELLRGHLPGGCGRPRSDVSRRRDGARWRRRPDDPPPRGFALPRTAARLAAQRLADHHPRGGVEPGPLPRPPRRAAAHRGRGHARRHPRSRPRGRP
ncbi:MAG: ATP-binding cassette domain-containing protein [Planctomycetota bacterium]